MKVNIKVSRLVDILDITSKFVSKNATLPILQNIYIKASIDEVIFRASDMEKYVEIKLPADIQVEWAITVNANMFLQIVQNIDDENVELNVDQQTQIMTIKSWKDMFEINGISANDYVALPEVPAWKEIKLQAWQISEWIKKVEYTVTEKNFSPVLTWVYLKSKNNNSLLFVGTDSFRLTEYSLNAENLEDFDVIIPKTATNDIKKIADYSIQQESSDVTMKYSDNLVAFDFQIWDMKILATTLLIQWNFPDYDKEEIMPTQFNTEVILDKDQFDKAIKKIWILTKDINNFIQIEVSTDTVTVSSGKTDKWKWKTNIPAIVTGEWLTLGVNGKYISDFIKSIEADNVSLNIVDSQKPMLIADKDVPNYRYVIRPLVN